MVKKGEKRETEGRIKSVRIRTNRIEVTRSQTDKEHFEI